MAIADKVCEDHDASLGATALSSPKLKEADAIRKLSRALGGQLIKTFSHGSLQGDTLIFYLKHPGAVAMFNGQKADIRTRMAMIWKEENLKGTITFTKFEAKAIARPLEKREEPAPYQDKASGDFEINCTSERLRLAFEKIQKNIKERHRGSSS